MKLAVRQTEKKEYIVQVTIGEARNLKAVDSSGLCDPFIRITVANLPPQVTDPEEKTTSVSWNQTFTFSGLLLSETDLQKMEILLEVFSRNEFLLNDLIGSSSIGLGTLYKNMNHEFYNIWLPVTDPERKWEVRGYLLCSMYILGPGDQPPAHNLNEVADEMELDEFADIDEVDMTAEQLKMKKEKMKNIAILDEPTLINKGYQLNVNIVRAEEIAVLGMNQPDPFISVRVGNTVLITNVAKATNKPQFQCRLVFPIFFPVLNDKITIRVWDKRVARSDLFIANIPENPYVDNFFSVNYLQSVGGNIPFRWVNLYSIPKDERPSTFSELFFKKQQYTEGTEYMGRVLISMNLIPHENPGKGRSGMNGFNEPDEVDYVLMAEVYEFEESKKTGDMLMVSIKWGGANPIESEWVEPDEENDDEEEPDQDEEKFNQFKWNGRDAVIEETINVKMPMDRTQLPDVIISLWTPTMFGGKTRVGYVRVPATSQTLVDDKPTWFKLKNPLNNFDGDSTGYLLAKVTLKEEQKKSGVGGIGGGTQIIRQVKTRPGKQKMNLIVFIYGCYDLAPEEYSQDIIANVQVCLGEKKLKDGLFETTDATRFPVFDLEKNTRVISVDVDPKMEFTPNLVIKVHNTKTLGSTFMSSNRSFIGECILPAKAIRIIDEVGEFKPDPQFYTIEKEGIQSGKFLASFFYAKSQAMKIPYDLIRKNIGELLLYKKVFLKIGALGVRNLDTEMTQPRLRIFIPSIHHEIVLHPNKEIITAVEGRSSYEKSQYNCNPSFFETKVEKKEIEFPENHLLNPFIEIELYDEANPSSTSLRYFSSVSALNFMDDWVGPNDRKDAQDDFEREFDHFTPKQPVQARSSSKGSSVRQSQKGMLTKLKEKREKDLKEREKRTKQILKEIEEAKDEDEEGNGLGLEGNVKEEKNDEETEEAGNEGNEAKQGFQNPFGDQMDQGNNITNDGEEGEKENAVLEMEQEQIIQENVYYMTKDPLATMNIAMKAFSDEGEMNAGPVVLSGFLFSCSIEQKEEEAKRRKEKIQNLLESIKELKQGANNEEDIIKRSRKIKKLKRNYMTELKFLGYIVDEAEFNYGREILKGSASDKLELPYTRIELFKHHHKYAIGKKSRTIRGNRILPGYLTKGILKLAIKIRDVEAEREMKEKRMYLDDPSFEFSIFKSFMMNELLKITGLKARIYLFRALNLKGIQNTAGIRHRMAGVGALSAATPYPEVEVGDGINNMDQGIVKKFTDKARKVENTLNALFFATYELDAILPIDWNLRINIYSADLIVSTFMGSASVDIEDRFFGNKERLGYYSLLYYKKHFEEKMKKPDKNKGKISKKLSDIQAELARERKQEEPPVEYQFLSVPGRANRVGSLEMICDVMTFDEWRQKPQTVFEAPRSVEWEVRLIIWEVFDVPLGNKKAIDLYVRVSLDEFGWKGESVSLDTDTHNGCEDGYAIWNWRMIFHIKTPCDVPRLQIKLMDFETFGSDDAIGDAMISMKRVIRTLDKEGRYELPPKRIPLTSSQNDGKKGDLVISMKVIPKAEAESIPVGIGQEEPNQDPHLEAPKIGRNISDFLKGTGFDFSLFNFGLFKKVGIYICCFTVVVLVVIILFIQPGLMFM